MAATYEPIATTTLGSAQASVTFSSISSAYTDLVLVCTGAVVSGGAIEIQVGNGSVDTGSNYSRTTLYGTGGGGGGSGRDSNITKTYAAFGSDNVPSIGQAIINFQNYSNTTTYKTLLYQAGEQTQNSGATIALWRSTSAINIITITGYSSNLITGSTFTLYGITAA